MGWGYIPALFLCPLIFLNMPENECSPEARFLRRPLLGSSVNIGTILVDLFKHTDET